MYDSHSKLTTFYNEFVRLGKAKRDDLAEYRDKNIKRLKNGLESLEFALPVDTCNQGSYAMSTMVQRQDNDYDIDVAVIFSAETFPSNSLKARQRVLEGILEGGGNFKEEPEARTNAVTVWYAEGYHVDLAVYRTYIDVFGNKVIEHAGTEWRKRNPTEITTWFVDEVATKSPSPADGATVDEGQLQRIVQLLKMFAKSRSSWKLPGGLLISVLTAECYRPDAHRDDLALYNTMSAIRARIQLSPDVLNPVDSDYYLTYKDEYINQISEFEERLGYALDKLTPLINNDDDDLVAYSAWDDVFCHEYWSELAEGVRLSRAAVAKSIYVVSNGGIRTEKPSESSIQSPEHRFFGDA